MPSRIVTYAHRLKRPPRKKAKAAAMTGPAIVTVTSKRNRIRRREMADDNTEASPGAQSVPCADDAAARA